MRLILIIFISCLSLTARGQSYQEHLNSPTPQWLNIAKPIHVSPEPLEVDDSISKELVDKTGGAKFIEKTKGLT